ncbi:MAG: murein L,D-transpeptidase family protein [Burkholderiales bacterium]
MLRTQLKYRPKGAIGQTFFLGLIIALAGASGTASAFVKFQKGVQNSSQNNERNGSALAKPDPEILLSDIYKDLANYHLRAAQAKADRLVDAYPNFRLGQLIHGDLLMMSTHVVSTFGDVPNGPQDKLKNLREEAIAHLNSLRERPDPGLVPRSVLQLRPDQKHVLIVDTRHSRMYVYENLGGQLKYVTDYYISQGKLGINKLRAGDQKTPLGVYYITGRLSGARLPDFYGAGALPINYPNEWDKINGRSGSGIWLHGTPSDSFSRPPLSSDGCVVLSNPDLHKLVGSVEIGKTPVVIADHVEFVSKAKWGAERNTAFKLVDMWRHDVESLNAPLLLSNYSRRFKSSLGEDLGTWFGKQPHYLPGTSLRLNLKDATFFLYPGSEDMIVGTFTQEAMIGKNRQVIRKRQYWAREGAQWKIVSESNL